MIKNARYSITNLANDVGEIYMYGVFGNSYFEEGITATKFSKDLRALGAVREIELRIFSPGGSVDEARAIYDLLMAHSATKTVNIDGLAASAASFVSMVGDTIKIGEGSQFMIHNARGTGFGMEKKEVRLLLEELELCDQVIAKVYSDRTGKPVEEIAAWMDETKWFSGKEAFDNGFATDLVENKKMPDVKIDAKIYERLGFTVPVVAKPKRERALENWKTVAKPKRANALRLMEGLKNAG